MPIRKTDFYVNKYTDTDLRTLLEAVQDEITRREDARKRRREEWVYRYSNEAYHYGNHIVVGNTVVVAVEKNGSIEIAKTSPINGDKFDLDTGVAVAYAKAIGLRVPDFI
jgi:hypothetical protein